MPPPARMIEPQLLPPPVSDWRMLLIPCCCAADVCTPDCSMPVSAVRPAWARPDRGLARLAAAEQIADQRGDQSAKSAALPSRVLAGRRLGGARQLPEHAAEALARSANGRGRRAASRRPPASSVGSSARRRRWRSTAWAAICEAICDEPKIWLSAAPPFVAAAAGSAPVNEALMDAARQMRDDAGEAGRVGGDLLQRGREGRRQRLHRRLRLLRRQAELRRRDWRRPVRLAQPG